MGSLRGAGVKELVYVSLTTVTGGSTPAPCSYLIKVTLVTCEKTVV